MILLHTCIYLHNFYITSNFSEATNKLLVQQYFLGCLNCKLWQNIIQAARNLSTLLTQTKKMQYHLYFFAQQHLRLATQILTVAKTRNEPKS